MDDLIKAVKSLISDIESMQMNDKNWFGRFSEFEDSMDGANIEWPNLAISVAKVKELLEPKMIEGELTKSMIVKQAFVGQGIPLKDLPPVETNTNDLKGLPFIEADFGEIETRYLAQNAHAMKVAVIYRRKLEAYGFKFDGDIISPPTGMGGFAVQEVSERLFKEAETEASKPELKVIK